MDRAKKIIKAYPPYGITGRGTGIAILDTGICPVADFTWGRNRIAAFKDFVNGIDTPYDDNGHGTHVSGLKNENYS